MMIRKFAYEEHQEYGGNGWRPLWMKGADPITGQGVAHDILEHDPKLELGVEAEFHALGASLWIRGENGYFAGRFYSVVDNYASDFISILERVHDGDETLRDPGKTNRLSKEMHGDADETLQAIVRKGMQFAKDEHGSVNDGCDLSLELPLDAHDRILGWTRKGYRAAIKRYRGADGYSINYLFGKINDAVERCTKHADLGMEMTVKIDLRNLNVTAFADYPEEPDYA